MLHLCFVQPPVWTDTRANWLHLLALYLIWFSISLLKTSEEEVFISMVNFWLASHNFYWQLVFFDSHEPNFYFSCINFSSYLNNWANNWKTKHCIGMVKLAAPSVWGCYKKIIVQFLSPDSNPATSINQFWIFTQYRLPLKFCSVDRLSLDH